MDKMIKPNILKNKPKVTITSNIINEEDTREIILSTLEFLCETVSKTLGPYGSTSIIQDRLLNHNMSKDGYTVLKNIMIKEDAPRTVFDIVLKISRTLVRKVGDGSTSSIVIANSLYKELNTIMIENNIPPKSVLDVLNKLSDILKSYIINEATHIDNNNMNIVSHIATVSTNNDIEMGELIKDIFTQVGKYGFIHVERSKTTKTHIDNTHGFELHRGYIYDKMVTEVDEKTAIYKKPYIFMTDSYLGEEDIEIISDLIGNLCLQGGLPLVILCKGTDSIFDNFIKINLTKQPNLPLLIVDISNQSKSAQNRFDDLAINLGCEPLRRSQGEEYPNTANELLPRLGSCKKIVCTDSFTRFIEGNGDELQLAKRIKHIEDLLEKELVKEGAIDNDETIYEIRKRLALLQNKMVTLYVGGNTEHEKETKKFLVEDAVFACKSALKHGYILGGNLIVPYLLRTNYQNILEELREYFKEYFSDLIPDIMDAVMNSFEYSFESVLRNKKLSKTEIDDIINECTDTYSIYNLRTEKFEPHNETTIINSAETDIEIMNSAFSIIGLLVTSNQLVKVNFKDMQ